MKKLLMLAAFITLWGCADKTSPERHASYFAYKDPTMVGGNYRGDPAAAARMNLHTYQDIYRKGQETKAKGATAAEAQTLAEEIYKSAVSSTKNEEIFMNMQSQKTTLTPDERAAQLWGQTLKETFLDGYNGVK